MPRNVSGPNRVDEADRERTLVLLLQTRPRRSHSLPSRQAAISHPNDGIVKKPIAVVELLLVVDAAERNAAYQEQRLAPLRSLPDSPTCHIEASSIVQWMDGQER